MKDAYLIPFYLPQEGCPHACIYCNAFLTAGEPVSDSKAFFDKRIRSFLSTRKGRGSRVEAAFYGGSFGDLTEEKRERYISYLRPYMKKGLVDSLRVSLRPDSVDKRLVFELKKAKVRVAELGVQSMNDHVLDVLERGHDSADVKKAVVMLRKAGIKVSIHVMVGLPDEDEKEFFKSYERILELSPDFLRIHPTIVLRGTELEDRFNRGLYRPLSIEDAVRVCARAYSMARRKNIQVLRMGLQANELLDKDAVMAGPYHPAFGELVMSGVYFDMMKKALLRKGFKGKERVIVSVNPRELSKALGAGRRNIERLAYECKVKELEIERDPKMKEGKVSLRCS